MCGDSTSREDVERLMDGKKADMVFTDPPYGVDYDGGHATDKRRDKLKNDDNVDMYDLPVKNAFEFSKADAPLYLWFADRFAMDVLGGLTNAGYLTRAWIIWNKNVAQFGAIGAQYKTKHEPCIYAYKKGRKTNWDGPNNEVTVWDVSRDNKNEHHPTQKPTELARRAIGNHEVDMVLDLFGGSGSTLIACEKTKRKCRVMELDPKYCDVIIKRWEDYTGKKAELIDG
jgi:site-specific DNA-methyltransferase (adenine-specific)